MGQEVLIGLPPPSSYGQNVQFTIELHIVGSIHGKGGNLLKYTIWKLW